MGLCGAAARDAARERAVRSSLGFLFCIVCATVLAAPAQARVDIQVDLSSQTMQVSAADGEFSWPISSARAGFSTPRGTYGVERMEAMHLSRKYHNSPMPHSLFFRGGYAIHGTYATASLGQPASHGCIRIAPENAAALYEMVRAEGATITIRGTAPGFEPVAQRTYARQSEPFADDLSIWGNDAVTAKARYRRWMNNPNAY